MLVRLDQIERGSELIALLESLKQGGTIPSVSFLEIINKDRVEAGLKPYTSEIDFITSIEQKEDASDEEVDAILKT